MSDLSEVYFHIGKDDNLYAAAPPLEALRWVLCVAAAWPGVSSRKRRCVMIHDVRRAYFYASIQCAVYTELPRARIHRHSLCGVIYAPGQITECKQLTHTPLSNTHGALHGV